MLSSGFTNIIFVTLVIAVLSGLIFNAIGSCKIHTFTFNFTSITCQE